MSAKFWADVFAKVWMNIRTIGREHVFANFGTNVVVSFRICHRANIFTNRCMEIGADIFRTARTNFRAANFWMNRNFGEWIAAKNI